LRDPAAAGGGSDGDGGVGGTCGGAGQPEAGSLRPGHASGAAPPSRSACRSAAITWAAGHGHGPGHCRGL